MDSLIIFLAILAGVLGFGLAAHRIRQTHSRLNAAREYRTYRQLIGAAEAWRNN